MWKILTFIGTYLGIGIAATKLMQWIDHKILDDYSDSAEDYAFAVFFWPLLLPIYICMPIWVAIKKLFE